MTALTAAEAATLVGLLEKVAEEPELLWGTFVRLQSEAIEMRDARMFVLPAPNGFVVKEKDGTDSHIIRIPGRNLPSRIVAGLVAELRGEPREEADVPPRRWV